MVPYCYVQQRLVVVAVPRDATSPVDTRRAGGRRISYVYHAHPQRGRERRFVWEAACVWGYCLSPLYVGTITVHAGMAGVGVHVYGSGPPHFHHWCCGFG